VKSYGKGTQNKKKKTKKQLSLQRLYHEKKGDVGSENKDSVEVKTALGS